MRSNIALILVFSLLCSCKSSHNIDPNYISEIEEYRQEQIKSLTQGGRPLNITQKENLAFYDVNDKYEVNSTVVLAAPAESFEVPTYSGQKKSYRKYADLHFELDKISYALEIYKDARVVNLPGFRDKLFLMFKDLTNDESTYGGGRYIYLSENDIVDGTLLIDFNKAFNPYCAYSDGYNCPIPPRVNHLDVKILAGEKDFQKNN